jgi:Spy/CpxP family protein refolding chaperone
MSRRIWAASLAVAAFVAVGATGFVGARAANGAGWPGGEGGGHWGHGDRLGFELFLRQLDLDEGQRGQIKSILSQQRAAAEPLWKQLRSEKATLSSQFFAPGALQASDLAPQVQKLAALQQQLLDQRIQTAVAMRNVLKPAQLAHAAQLKAQIDALHQQMHSLLEPPASSTPQ